MPHFSTFSDRRLAWAFAASAALHGLALWPALLPRAAAQVARPLVARLQPGAAPAAAGQAAAQGGRGNEAPRLVRRTTTPSAPRPAVAAQPDTAAASEAAPASVADAGSAAPSAVAATMASPADPPAVGAPGGSLDADGLRRYGLALAAGARPYRRYPPLALERGWSGTVDVRIEVAADGRSRRMRVARSSGHGVLDGAAVDMLSRSAAATPLPESLKGKEFALSLPVVFDLAEELGKRD